MLDAKTRAMIDRKKEHPDLPDFYLVTLKELGGEKEVIKVVDTNYVDKVFYNIFDDKGKLIKQEWKVNPNPFYEFKTHEGDTVVFPLSLGRVSFNKDFQDTMEIRKELLKKAKKEADKE